jgi:hypothetical protein
MKAAWDRGINTFDTANVYSNGVSEELIAKFIEKVCPLSAPYSFLALHYPITSHIVAFTFSLVVQHPPQPDPHPLQMFWPCRLRSWHQHSSPTSPETRAPVRQPIWFIPPSHLQCRRSFSRALENSLHGSPTNPSFRSGYAAGRNDEGFARFG